MNLYRLRDCYRFICRCCQVPAVRFCCDVVGRRLRYFQRELGDWWLLVLELLIGGQLASLGILIFYQVGWLGSSCPGAPHTGGSRAVVSLGNLWLGWCCFLSLSLLRTPDLPRCLELLSAFLTGARLFVASDS